MFIVLKRFGSFVVCGVVEGDSVFCLIFACGFCGLHKLRDERMVRDWGSGPL